MIRFSNISRRRVALLFSALVLNAILCVLLCDLEIIEYSNSHHTSQVAAEDRSHEHLDQHNHDQTTHDQLIHKHNESSNSEDDACCDDIATQYVSSIFNNKIEQPSLEILPQIVELIFYDHFLPSISGNILDLFYRYEDPPPLIGYTIRKEIQSFLN